MVISVKPNAISKKFFNPEQIESALAAAAELPVEDAENPRTDSSDWDNAIVSYSYEELKEKLAQKQRCDPQKAPLKVATTIRFDADVLAALKATGKGWQTRVNAVMREWIATHPRGS
ncbi:MAG: BrnA antitoxin family protein [Gammaproteobacteria bacterium]|nr:BrnA antitoxin family protein [Gammaproteobacteria bacterium]MCP5197825.1 BrnA antitoxin family protein [Gammaproteobacteria bacterium]